MGWKTKRIFFYIYIYIYMYISIYIYNHKYAHKSIHTNTLTRRCREAGVMSWYSRKDVITMHSTTLKKIVAMWVSCCVIVIAIIPSENIVVV